MFFKKYELYHFTTDFNWRLKNGFETRSKKFFLKLNVTPVRGSFVMISFGFFENSEIFFQNFLTNKNFWNFSLNLHKWLVLKKNKIFF
jgi:hypothetical protein